VDLVQLNPTVDGWLNQSRVCAHVSRHTHINTSAGRSAVSVQ